ncbi:LysR family transcriptional regulator [Nonomuraea sp. NPDC055795]
MIDVHQLSILREVAKHGSFNRAADTLSFTPSASSQQIAALERGPGDVLVPARHPAAGQRFRPSGCWT